MIYPIPAGVHPYTHLCGCGDYLTMPWRHELGGHALRCIKDPDHNTYKSKYKRTRALYNSDGSTTEVDIMTGQAVEETSLSVADHSSALARVKQANAIGMFPDKMTPEQMDVLATVTLAYGLDPYMGELIPYQGKPYVTIKGRRRKDAEAGHHGRISFRPLNAAELELYYEAGALDRQDLAMFCVVEDVDTRASVEGFGRVLASERKGNAHLPTVSRVIEMAQKRAEVRAREMLWGPISKPMGLEAVQVAMEGDEANIVEGTARMVDETPQTASPSLPDYGECPDHLGQFFTTKENNWGGLQVSHRHEGGFCNLGKILGQRFEGLWLNRHENMKGINDWLKERFEGKTWSKMSIEQMRDAIAILQGVDVVTGEIQEEKPVGDIGDGIMQSGDFAPVQDTAEDQAWQEAHGMVE